MKHSYAEIRKICLKPNESEKPLYAQWITHTFSTRLIYLLQNARFTPNQISAAALMLAFLSLPFFIQMTPFSILMGATFIEVYYVLDAMDGQWARLKEKKSLTGAFLDYLSNYAIHPPLLFSLAWGIYLKIDQPHILFIGFLAAFSTLWINLIWNLRATILLEYLASKGIAPLSSRGAKRRGISSKSFLKITFESIHKSLVFPWFINILTAMVILSVMGDIFFSIAPEKIFYFVLYYYGSAGPLIAAALTLHWIYTRKIDHAPELGNC